MTQRDILDDLRAAHPEFKRGQMKALIDDFFLALCASLKANGRVRIKDLGTFEVKQRPARVGRNPKTKAPLEIPAAKVARFHPAKKLKGVINQAPPVRLLRKKTPVTPVTPASPTT